MDKGNLHQSHTESIQKIKRQMALQILYLLTNIAHNPHQKKVVHIKEKKRDKSLNQFVFWLDVFSPCYLALNEKSLCSIGWPFLSLMNLK